MSALVTDLQKTSLEFMTCLKLHVSRDTFSQIRQVGQKCGFPTQTLMQCSPVSNLRLQSNVVGPDSTAALRKMKHQNFPVNLLL